MDAPDQNEMTRMMKVCEMIQQDCERDAMTLDGTPFTGAALAPRLGEMYAVMKALATIQHRILVSMRCAEASAAMRRALPESEMEAACSTDTENQ